MSSPPAQGIPHSVIWQRVFAIPHKALQGIHLSGGTGDKHRSNVSIIPCPDVLAFPAPSPMLWTDDEGLDMSCDMWGFLEHA